jgi:hypothetical protein
VKEEGEEGGGRCSGRVSRWGSHWGVCCQRPGECELRPEGVAGAVGWAGGGMVSMHDQGQRRDAGGGMQSTMQW